MKSQSNPKRRKFLSKSGALLLGSVIIPSSLSSSPMEEDDLLLHSAKVLREADAIEYNELWANMAKITEKELDWKPNPESNSVRWILGHLCWFEEWTAGAMQQNGRYLTDKKPTSITDQSFEEVKGRLETARAKVIELCDTITPEQLRTEVTFVGRFQRSIHSILRIHATHLAGHRYQVRYIRGTYSRVFHTIKADFDPW